jgi:probable rRNA maturation factor
MITVMVKRPFLKLVSKKAIEKSAQTTLNLNSKVIDQNITIAIVDDKSMRKLNLDFLGEDKTTDVLSFNSDEPDPDSGHINLGDIIISYPTAAAHAAEAGNDIESEIQLLVVHGVLHLLGNDHHTTKAKSDMWKKQTQALVVLNVHINQIYGDDENS